MPRVKFMLWLKDKTGVSEEFISAGSLSELVNTLSSKYRVLDELYRRGELIVLVNGVSVNPAAPVSLKEEDEVVLLPPVSGG
ncbi:hypothetical protein TCELL_0696 [Thermogladius calderae 1633]|uniref:MoaD/ThiS family protein n=1 Tax=Thermogladius calderae (strain DSM 22663 / VKM B-2946 / 1633) TaxID=1184251 RepID=I3TED2_THEC1|nr:MoaD/ThiS family protein [Thermogladius calderae]AFK51120.1 hypothetical protein TCELL_0696 [Thermogladius calderae 1633]